jgi:hypothetical protein
LSVFARYPQPDEMQVALAHLDRTAGKTAAGPGKLSGQNAAEKAALEDILWALINTKEFLFNH